MKAMSQTLYLVVAAVVILVVALVVLTIFLGVIPLPMGLTETKSLCMTQATGTCSAFGQMPTTWNVRNLDVVVDGKTKKMSCSELEGLTDCRCDSEKRTLTGACAGGSSSSGPQPVRPIVDEDGGTMASR